MRACFCESDAAGAEQSPLALTPAELLPMPSQIGAKTASAVAEMPRWVPAAAPAAEPPPLRRVCCPPAVPALSRPPFLATPLTYRCLHSLPLLPFLRQQPALVAAREELLAAAGGPVEPGLAARHQAPAGAAARRADRLPAPGAARRHRLPHRCRLVSAVRQLLCWAWEPVQRSQRRHVTYACTCMSCSGRISSLLWAPCPPSVVSC